MASTQWHKNLARRSIITKETLQLTQKKREYNIRLEYSWRSLHIFAIIMFVSTKNRSSSTLLCKMSNLFLSLKIFSRTTYSLCILLMNSLSKAIVSKGTKKTSKTNFSSINKIMLEKWTKRALTKIFWSIKKTNWIKMKLLKLNNILKKIRSLKVINIK